MNYGIQEIEEFQAPSRKPWLMLLVFVILGLIFWQSVRIWKSRPAASPEDEGRVEVATTTNSPVVVAAPATGKIRLTPKKPPVDLKVSERAPVSTAGMSPSAALERAQSMASKGDRLAAHALLIFALKSAGAGPERNAIEQQLASINMELAFLPYDMPEKVDHVVRRGDSLDKISRKYGVTVESIQIGNDLKNPHLIKAGDHLRILDANFSIEVRKASHDLLLLMNGEFFKRYQFDKTPVGSFEVFDRITKPVWWRPDGREIPFGHEENILGTRWMAIRATGDTPPVKGYGIHGTWDDASIGKSESAGCVRMHNADVEQLFNLVPIGTKVTILK